MSRPSDRAYAQAVRELENEPKADRLSKESAACWLNRRAREIDAAAPAVSTAVASRHLIPFGPAYCWTRWFGIDEQIPEGAHRVEYAYAAPPPPSDDDAPRLASRLGKLADGWRLTATNRSIEHRDREYIEGYDKALNACAADLDAALSGAGAAAGKTEGRADG